MEYVFGTNDWTCEEVLKTKGKEHTNLSGFCETVREYEDCTIQDSFYVVRKDKSTEDTEGNCYDWYIIERHNRIIDRTKPIKAQAEQNTDAIDGLVLQMLEG